MIYSPSQTTTFQTCPTLHHLQRVEGWRPRVLQRRDAAAIVGSAFAVGMESWNRARQRLAGTGVMFCDAIAPAKARQAAEFEIARLTAAGCVPAPADRESFDFAPTIAARAVERVCADDPIPADWTIVDVERPFPGHGNARPDLICRDKTGALVIVDYKVAMSLKDSYVADRLDGYRRSWQMYHYRWAASEVYGERPNDVGGAEASIPIYQPATVNRYAIVLVTIEPWRVRLEPYTYDEAAYKRWLDSAWSVWERMGTPPLSGPEANWQSCETKFGKCAFLAACWQHGLDPALMELDYRKVMREEAGT